MVAKLSLKNEENLNVKECFERYIDKCSIRNLSEETIKLYQFQFDMFYRTLDNPEKSIGEVSTKDIDRFILTERKSKTCNDITINSYLRGVRAFLYYAIKDFIYVMNNGIIFSRVCFKHKSV